MRQTKLTLISVLALISSFSCDTENKPDKSAETLKSIENQTPVSLDLSLPENTFSIDMEPKKQKPTDAVTNTITKHLAKLQDKNYNFSGNIHLTPDDNDNNNEKLLPDKVDGDQINLEFNFKK